MRFRLLMLCLAFTVASLAGCGASATVPTPPATAKGGPPPGTSAEMLPQPKKAESAKKK